MPVRELHSGTNSIRLPWPKKSLVKLGGNKICCLQSWRELTDDPDFDPGNQWRNVIALDADLNVSWIIEDADPPADTDECYHERLHERDGRLITETNVGSFYEVDPDTGTILDSWNRDQFKINGSTIEFDGPVKSLRYDDGTYLIVTSENIFGYSDQGIPLWKRPIEREWRALSVGGPGALRSKRGGAGPGYDLALDLRSGEIVHTSGLGKPETFGDLDTLD